MISLSVVSLNAPKITGQAMESIVTTAGPFGGSCSIYNSNGTELLTDFSVSCGERQSFTTISPSGRPLQATHPFAYKFEYSANNERFVLAYAGPLPFFSLRLPAGFVLVKVTVCSAFGFCNSACEFQLLLKLRQLPSLGFCFSLAKFASKIVFPWTPIWLVCFFLYRRQFSGDRLLLEAKSLNTAWLYHVGSLIWPRIAKQLLGTWPDVLANLTAHWISALASVGAYAIEANQLPCDSLAPGIVLAEALINNNSDHPAVVESTRRLMLSTVLSSSASDCQPLTVSLLGSVSKFHRADIGLSVSYAGFSTGRLQIQLQFPAATGWVVPFDMNAVVNYRPGSVCN
uniref:REJ domain-containing protein n=1 Tax=Macrostomum lignano TaxID=282301 RepID=A0A1I8IVP0_9PLAT